MKKFITVLIFCVLGTLVLFFCFLRNNYYQDQKLKEQIGQMIMIGFRATEVLPDSDVCKMIKDAKIGGVTLFDYDVPSKSFPRNIINYEQTKKLISDLQNCSNVPLFIAVDAEGGQVNRLGSKYGFLEISSAEKMGQDKTLQTVFSESVDLATELKGLGFNMNFAPVVDVNINSQNPIIGKLSRSFSSDSKEVVKQAEIFIENMQKNNIISVVKHFPGHGSSTQDTHLGLTDITKTYKTEELLPYKELQNKGLLNAVMVGHLVNKNIDKEYPATLSSNFLNDILRNQVGFKGIIISDDMQMNAISDNYGLEESIITAINAGVDILLFSNNAEFGYDTQLAYKIRDVIFSAVKSSKTEKSRIIDSYNRIMSIKRCNIEKSAEK